MINNEMDQKILDTTLSQRGYVIRKNLLNSNEIIKIKKDLSVKPIIFGNYQNDIKDFKLYKENENKLYLPKSYGIKKFGNPLYNKIEHLGLDIDIDFQGNLRENQKPVVEAFIKSTKTVNGGGIICLGCGFGKTIISLYILSLLKKKTLVVVHKEFLANQWIDRINFFLPSAKVGKIQQNTVDVEEKDIVIAMLQSISMKDYPSHIFETFGFVIIDECHHLGAEVFSKALPKINTRYMLGLSATPDRKDGLRKVFEFYLGDMVFCIKGREPEKVLVNLIEYNCINPNFCKEYTNFKGQIIAPKMINQIGEDPERLKLIIEELKSLIEQKRKILILSDRRNHLSDIKKEIDLIYNDITGYYVGGTKQEILRESENKQIILGTYSMASEGMDIPALNTIILATPKTDVEQSVGRILREKKEVRLFDPLIIDIIDQIPNFIRQSQHRKRFYKKNNYIISKKKINEKKKNNFQDQNIEVKFSECLL